MRRLIGNDSKYDVSAQTFLKPSVLTGKRILWLGSSITLGYASENQSFADYIAKRNGCVSVKEADSGTTLVDDSEDSYISRLKKHAGEKYDLFVCQLSTNDISQRKPFGKTDDTDVHTVIGAIKYIVSFAKKNFDCPIVFLTSQFFLGPRYGEMVALLKSLADDESFSVIDLYNDSEFNDVTVEDLVLYLADPIHPTKAGYLLWWTPKIESALEKVLLENKALKE